MKKFFAAFLAVVSAVGVMILPAAADVAEAVETAPQTFDLGIIAAVVVLFSAAGYVITKSEK